MRGTGAQSGYQDVSQEELVLVGRSAGSFWGLGVKVTPIEHGLDLLGGSGTSRSSGLHISDIYNSLYSELEPTRYVAGSAPNTTKMAMGLAWEAYLESLLIRQGVEARRPSECVTPEGIAFSPDLLIENGQPRVGEIKLTWMSSGEDITSPKFAKWMTQAKIYCYYLGVARARFYPLYVNGNYRDRRNPELLPVDVAFSARELQEEHQMLMNHARAKGML